MPIINTAQYVKFVRGTPTAFSNLTNKDSDTLYFISETNASTGSLYLGDKLIAGSISTSELGTVILNNVGDGDILMYDASQSAWINTSPPNLVDVMQGATSSLNGIKGLVPTPKAGDQEKFLRGDGTWAFPQVNFDNKVFTLNSNDELTLKNFIAAPVGTLPIKSSNGDLSWVQPSTLQTDLTEVTEQILNLQEVVNGLVTNKLQRKIVANIGAIDKTADDAENYIYMVPNGTNDNNHYSEYMIIDGELELVGNNYEGNLDGYVTTIVFNTTVGDLNTSITNLQNELQDLSTQFDDYVTLIKYNEEIGDIGDLIRTQNNGDTIIHQVNDLTMRLTWSNLTS